MASKSTAEEDHVIVTDVGGIPLHSAPGSAPEMAAKEPLSIPVERIDEEQPAIIRPELPSETDPEIVVVVEDIPPNGGYGWVCVACNFLLNANTWGINSTYGVFLSYYLSHNFFPGTTSLDYAFIGGLSISMAMAAAPVSTRIVHLFGTWTVLHLGIFLQTLALLGASFSTKKYQIILSQGVCFGWGMGLLFSASVGIIPQWFTTKRSIANAISSAGSGFGAVVYSLAAQHAIKTVGLHWCFRILACCSLVINLIVCNVVRDRNKQVGSRQVALDLKILRRPEFLLVQAWSWFSMFAYIIIVFSVPSYASSIGLSSSQGAILNAILNVGQAVGRPIIGLVSDRYGRINIAMFSSFMAALTVFCFWIPVEAVSAPYGLLLFFCLVGGGFAGNYWATVPPVVAEVVGLVDMPAALSLTWLSVSTPTTVAEPIALELRDTNKKSWIYLRAQIFTAFMYLGAAFCLLILRGWTIGTVQLTSIGPSAGEPKAQEGSGTTDRVLTRDEARRAAWKPWDLCRRMMMTTKI